MNDTINGWCSPSIAHAIHTAMLEYSKRYRHQPLYMRLDLDSYRALRTELNSSVNQAAWHSVQANPQGVSLAQALVNTLQTYTPGVQYRGHYRQMLVLTIPNAQFPLTLSNHILTIPTAPDAYAERKLVLTKESLNAAPHVAIARSSSMA